MYRSCSTGRNASPTISYLLPSAGLVALTVLLTWLPSIAAESAAEKGVPGKIAEQFKSREPKGKQPRPKQTEEERKARQKAAAEAARKRAQALEALLARLGVGEGATVADIGAGGGQDTRTVGPSAMLSFWSSPGPTG